MIMGWAEYVACAVAMKTGLQEMLQLWNLKVKRSL